MSFSLVNKLEKLRRNFLSTFIPEFVWPKKIIIDNVHIDLRGKPYSFGIKWVLVKGNYEVAERNLIRGYDFTGESIIEMGGSIGILTAILANRVGKTGKVVSVEASQKISSDSRNWLEKNPNTKVITGIAFPVSNLSGKVEIIKFEEPGSTLIGKVLYKFVPNAVSDSAGIYDIQKISLLHNINPQILVVDVEGSEKIILEIKPDFPSTIKILLIELHPLVYGEYIRDKIINRITEEGFFIKSNVKNVYLFERPL